MHTNDYLSIDTFSGYVRFEQVKSRNFYESEGIRIYGLDTILVLLKSYNTIVACIDYRKGILFHFGKGYSRTTSKQLTQYINENRGYFFNAVKYLDSSYNWDKFKKEYLDRA